MMSFRPCALLLVPLLSAGWANQAAAGDVLVTFEGAVSHTTGLWTPMPVFGVPAHGTPFTLEVSVFTPGSSNMGTLFIIDQAESRLTIGAGSAFIETSPWGGLEMIDDDPTYGDWLSVTGDIAGFPGLRVSGQLFDTASSLFATEDVGSLSGQTILPLLATQSYEVRSPQGSIRMMVDTISIEALTPQSIGIPYCAAVPNSTGAVGHLGAVGLADPTQNSMMLIATALPAGQMGVFLASMHQGFAPHPGGSAGNLCLGAAIGRFYGPGQVQSSDPAGRIALALDLTAVPQGTGATPVLAGQDWNFQLWHRDVAGGAPTSNFTRGLSVTFQ